MKRRYLPTASLIFTIAISPSLFAHEPEVINVWPQKAPGEKAELPPEENITKPTDPDVGGLPIIKLANVSTPTLSIYRPDPSIDNGAAVIICPGGGHHILAMDHEGTEVAEWLTSIGVTGIVLKYRVPARDPDQRYHAAVQDAQRAVRLVRSEADELGIAEDRIGILGFSAGGETAGLTALLHDQRFYDAVDSVDELSARPDFAILIYPAYLVQKDSKQLNDHVKVDEDDPPTFLAHSFDDPVSVDNSLQLASALKRVNVPAEAHIYATGGHGYGIRDTGEPCNSWPKRCEEWMARQGWLKRLVNNQ